ncbi:citrate synthase [Thermosporothrix hazakensis]|jgi:citrate synthase|uniref:Citrate synthase n=2 Tax=Thermosporothrix TaxID=768650 RepID=A0A326UF78_THEHA|nr:citrate synthase [Thermosporothrix hazakensis]PZW36684.1 citrate synthase [Thermosporothrix hazakensis]BBH89152.1 citrate (Si)-synthase [Thermosporothrix sp. COM3]GCE47335.1 citrate (Si)-synthase [Thermosporothrix hazakensis]
MTTATAGLEDVVATTSSICDLDGKLGKLTYFGVDIHDLARYSTFEETAYLLWHGTLPTEAQLEEVKAQLCAHRVIPEQIIALMKLLPAETAPMNALRTAISALAAFDTSLNDTSTHTNEQRAIRLTAAFPTIIAAWHHIRNGREPIAPLSDGSHAANFLYMLNGEKPDEYSARVLDVALILHADHELNASTFAARVTAGTKADMYASITAAISALSGPLHGGANEQVMRTLLKIGEPEKAEAYIQEALARKERIMGFGHRVYRTEDPRATHLREMSKELGERKGETRWFEISRKIEAYMKEHKGLNANVDFYSASVYYTMGIPVDLDTPIFASSRVAGWTAHILEQYANNRLIRPRADYVGPKVTEYVPLEQRG